MEKRCSELSHCGKHDASFLAGFAKEECTKSIKRSSGETAPVSQEIRPCNPGTKWGPRKGNIFDDSEIVEIIKFLEDSECLKDSDKYVVDLGANDGHGPSEKLFFPPFSYPGLIVEGEMKWFSSMHKVIPSPNVKKRISWISPSTISHILSKEGVPNFFVYLKIDMDADDCATLVAILASGFRPRVVQMEMTPEIPYQLSFGVLPLFKYGNMAHAGFQSCSVGMMHAIAEAYEYKLISVGGAKDAIFVHSNMSMGFHILDVSTAYYDFAACCWADPDPYNTRFLEQTAGVKLSEIYPTEWLGSSMNSSLKDKVSSSVLAYMTYACAFGASNQGIRRGIAHTQVRASARTKISVCVRVCVCLCVVHADLLTCMRVHDVTIRVGSTRGLLGMPFRFCSVVCPI